MKKVYIACPFNERDEAKRVRDILLTKGITSTSRWIDTHLTELDLLSDADREREALADIADVQRAEEFVYIAKGQSTSGGRDIELGYALAEGMKVWFIGEPFSIFHYHPQITIVAEVEDVHS